VFEIRRTRAKDCDLRTSFRTCGLERVGVRFEDVIKSSADEIIPRNARRGSHDRCSKLLTLQRAHLSLMLKEARAILGNLLPLTRVGLKGLKNKVPVMTANHVTPFEAFKSFVEFYPKLGATIAFGTMAAAARMIPTSGAAISDAPQAKGPELVSLANISSPRKRSNAQQSSSRKRSTAHNTPRKTSTRATGRRKAA
jgi:hypothetical protein